MRLPSIFTLVLIFCLIAAALPGAPVQAAQCVPWKIDLSPEFGPPGTEVTVHGYYFPGNEYVDIYYDGTLVSQGTETRSNGDFTVVITIPEDFTGYYQVYAEVGYVDANTYFHVRPGLTVDPQEGPVDTNVTVTGQGFAENEGSIDLVYYLDGSYQTIASRIVANAKGSWQTSFRVPASTRGEHKLDAEGSESKFYEVGDAIFRVTAEIDIDKWSGIEGDTVTMTGTKFGANERDIAILFDGEPVATDPTEIKADGGGDWEASFQVPGVPAGEYRITAEGERTSREDVGELAFDVQPEFILSQDQGHVGMELTVTGRGFPAFEDIIILYDDSQVAIAETDEQGTLEVSFSVPESRHGEHQVSAKLTEGTNNTADLEIDASAAFTMESDPPSIPEQVSPTDKSRLGLFGEVTPTFEWSGVSDDSGVAYYRLQIATSPDFNGSSIIHTVPGLTGTSYTMKETEALPLGTYYWIVQAVDNAENESDWSVNHSFRVGLLPRWGFILAVVGAVILFIALIRALLKRRIIYYDKW